MYPPQTSSRFPDKAAHVMASSGDTLTYRELDERSNQLAHALRRRGIGVGSTLAVVLENRLEWPVVVAAAMRSGLYITPINCHLTTPELAGILAEAMEEGRAGAVVTSARYADAVAAAVASDQVDDGVLVTSLDSVAVEGVVPMTELIEGQPTTPVDDEVLGARAVYSGGTSGNPKVFRQRLLGKHPSEAPPRHPELNEMLDIGEDTVFLSPAPTYHTAPFTFLLHVIGRGGTVVTMEKFDAEAALAAIERHQITHSQWVPTMLTRLIRLDRRTRGAYDLSSHRVAWTCAAPCPPWLKDAVMAWWGPMLHEYYGSSEGFTQAYASPRDATEAPGTVGRPLFGAVHVLDESGREVPCGVQGQLWYEPLPEDFPYRNESDTGTLVNERGWHSLGDLATLDAEGRLFVHGRDTQTVISGGVNIYPQEVEAALLQHPAVSDVAVLGLPDEEMGARLHAYVATTAGIAAKELEEFARQRLAGFKVPRSYTMMPRLPRSATGKLNKGALLRSRGEQDPKI